MPQFLLKSDIDDTDNLSANVPDIRVRFANGVEDVLELKHVAIMPNSKNIDGSRLCNYLGSLKKEGQKSVVAVTGCLNRNTPQNKMSITMFSENSPAHSYFSLDIDGNVHSIRPKSGATKVVSRRTTGDFKKYIPLNFDKGVIKKDYVIDEQLESLAARMGDVSGSVPDTLSINFRFGIDTSAKSAIEDELSMTVDNYLSDLLTHTQAHYMLPSLNHAVTFEVMFFICRVFNHMPCFK